MNEITRIQCLFAPGVAVQVAQPATFDIDQLASVWLRKATMNRLREFSAGRACASAALLQLGIATPVIGRNPDCSPAWPPGTIGSITHTRDFCCAVVALTKHFGAIGVDAEAADPLEPDVERLICRSDELDGVADLVGATRHVASTILFSAKEAIYKAYYPKFRTFLDFQDVSIRFGPSDCNVGALRASLRNPQIAGADFMELLNVRWSLDEGRVYCGVSLPA